MALNFHQLEVFYEDLAQSLDTVAESKRELFLCKLCLMLARETDKPANLKSMIQAAQNHLTKA